MFSFAEEERARVARLTRFKREQLIVDYLNRGVSVAEIAARVGVGEKRMRAIIREILDRRMPGPPMEFVAIQVSRLNEAMLVAFSAMSPTNLEAVDRVVKIVRELDRYRGFCAAERRLPEASPGITVRGLDEVAGESGPFEEWSRTPRPARTKPRSPRQTLGRTLKLFLPASLQPPDSIRGR